jgi:polyhydroxyalkanoate synthesis regulator phasin
MAMYDWPELLRQWEHKKLTAEQAIGQLLQWGQETARTWIAWRAQLEALERQVAALVSRVEALERRLAALEGRQRRRDKGGTASQ